MKSILWMLYTFHPSINSITPSFFVPFSLFPGAFNIFCYRLLWLCVGKFAVYAHFWISFSLFAIDLPYFYSGILFLVQRFRVALLPNHTQTLSKNLLYVFAYRYLPFLEFQLHILTKSYLFLKFFTVLASSLHRDIFSVQFQPCLNFSISCWSILGFRKAEFTLQS